MRLEKDDAEKKEEVVVKTENKDDDNASAASTVAARNEEVSAANMPPPEDPTRAVNDPPALAPSVLPKPDEEKAEDKARAERSASETPEKGTVEEAVAEKKRQEKIAKAEQRHADADHSRGIGEMLTYTNSMYDELIMETQMFNEKYGGEEHPLSPTDRKPQPPETENKQAVECVEVPSTPTNYSGLSTPIEHQTLTASPNKNKIKTEAPFSPGSSRKERREEDEETERFSIEQACKEARYMPIGQRR